MAPAAVSNNSTTPDDSRHPFEFDSSVQSLVDSSKLQSLPAKFNLDIDTSAARCESLPVIDFAALTSLDADERSKAIAELAQACGDSGFFIVRKI